MDYASNKEIGPNSAIEVVSGLNGRSSLVGWVIGLGKEEDRTIQVSILYNHEACQMVQFQAIFSFTAKFHNFVQY